VDGGRIINVSYNSVSGAAGLTGLTLTFNTSKLAADEDVTFIIETPFGVFIFTTEQMLNWFDEDFGTYTITLRKSGLKVGVKKDGRSVVWNRLTPMARVGVPYTPEQGKATANLAVTDKNGRILPTSVYEKGMVYADIFMVGAYEAVYAAPTAFTDTARHWAKTSIDYVTMRGLITGTGSDYSPNTPITRAEFLMALGILSGADVRVYARSSYIDVPNTSSAMPYIEWATENRIVSGVGNNRFAPDSTITREQMAVMMANYAKATGCNSPITKEAAAFADTASISAWAKDAVISMQRADIISGKDNNLFDPQGSATRADAATILCRFVEYVISSRGCEGWSNDNYVLSKRVYYNQNGKRLTGWQMIDGERYYFGNDGVMRTGWQVIDDKRYYFYTNGKIAAGKWAEIGGKWYFFYEDGTLAVNITIDGYEIGSDGARKE